MRPQCDEFRLCGFRGPDRHGKDDAVKASIAVPVLNRQSVQLGTKQAQETARLVRSKHGQCARSSPNYTLAVISSDDIVHGTWDQIGGAPGMSKPQISVLNH